MAPEVLAGEPPTEAADLYAVGLMAYELLTGQYPYNRKLYVESLSLRSVGYQRQGIERFAHTLIAIALHCN